MSLKSRYYSILNLEEDATLEDLKKAYREKAKEYHPDVNSSEGATEKFIELSEAFEYVQNIITGKVYNPKKHSFENDKSNTKRGNEKWVNEQRQKARDRAAYYSKMKYEKFIRSEYYQSIQSMTIIFNWLLHLFTYFLIMLPVTGLLYGKSDLLWLGLLINVIFLPHTIHVFKFIKRPGFWTLFTSLRVIVQKKPTQIVLLSLINGIVFFKIILQTLFPYWIYFAVLFSMVSSVIYFTKKRNYVLRFGIIPLMLNCIFILNFVFSSNTEIEKYHYSNIQTGKFEELNYAFNTKRTSLIYLEGNQYQEYFGVRFFFDFAKVDNHYFIEYEFEEGLLGIRVLKKYSFE